MAAKVPASLKSIAHFIKIANENASRDPVVYYWCLYYAVQTGMQVDRSSPESLQFLTGLLSTLEAVKKQMAGNEAITNEVVAQAHLEEFAFKLFTYADAREKKGDVDNKVVQSFYTAGHVLDVLNLFGPLEDNIASTKKYAKWKATQIFTCLKNGTPYVPSQPSELDDLQEGAASLSLGGFPSPPTGYGAPPSAGGFDDPFLAPAIPPREVSSFPPSAPPRSTAPPPAEHGYGFPQTPSSHSLPAPSSSSQSLAAPANYVHGSVSAEALGECKKHCKWALSALDYEDVPAVVDNLRKALALVERRA